MTKSTVRGKIARRKMGATSLGIANISKAPGDPSKRMTSRARMGRDRFSLLSVVSRTSVTDMPHRDTVD